MATAKAAAVGPEAVRSAVCPRGGGNGKLVGTHEKTRQSPTVQNPNILPNRLDKAPTIVYKTKPQHTKQILHKSATDTKIF